MLMGQSIALNLSRYCILPLAHRVLLCRPEGHYILEMAAYIEMHQVVDSEQTADSDLVILNLYHTNMSVIICIQRNPFNQKV